MKFLNAIIFSILICNIFSEEENKDDAYTTFEKACNGEQYHIINYDKTDRVLELDWTDDDSFTLNVEFYSIGEKGIIGFFANASISEEVDEAAYDAGVLYQVDSEGYRLINVISDKAHTSSPKYSPTITPSIVAANKEVITEKFYKYFGWIECSGNGVAQFRRSEVLVIVNNGKLYQISKYLLFVMAALLL